LGAATRLRARRASLILHDRLRGDRRVLGAPGRRPAGPAKERVLS